MYDLFHYLLPCNLHWKIRKMVPLTTVSHGEKGGWGGGGAQLSMEHVLPQHIRYNKLQHSNSNKSLELRKEKTMLNNWATKTGSTAEREKCSWRSFCKLS